jgi:hypothetical protein
MVQEPEQKIQESWRECDKTWEKINREMENNGLLEFGPPENFTDLHNIVVGVTSHTPRIYFS